ncbi:MAG: DUF167 domain-containing protein [Candidatus Methylomirabilales bacterium]
MTQDGPDVLLAIRVQPRASRNELVARDAALTLRLTAPPVEGAANRAARRFLAQLLDLPPSRISLEGGEAARTKRLRIQGANAADVAARLQGALKA